MAVIGATLALGCGQTPAADPSGSAAATTALEDLDEVLASAVRRQDVLGVVAMVVDRDAVLYRGAHGTADDVHDMPIRTDAVFRIASMTKPVTSVAAMQLVERGRIGLDDPAADYLPDLRRVQIVAAVDAESGAYDLRAPETTMTVRHLLTHTAGFGYGFTSETIRDFEPRTDDRDVVGPILFDPGTSWWYGTNTDWVGRLVEAVSGQSLEDYFREHIFDPLRMPDTSFNVPEASWSRTMTLARRQAGGGLYQELRRDPSPVTTFNGGGGLWSTASDYSRFMRMWLNEGTLDDARVLATETVVTMGDNHVGALHAGRIVSALPERSNDFRPTADGRGRFGLGFLINLDDQPGRRAAGSLAWAGLYNTYFWIDPAAGVAGVLLTQVLPFADPQVLSVFADFEHAVYALDH